MSETRKLVEKWREEADALCSPLSMPELVADTDLTAGLLERCATELEAVLAEAGGGWQPISTAPKDGTRILVCRPAGSASIAAWGGSRPACWREDNAFGRQLYKQPTDWQPLPEPPEPAK